MKTRISAYRSAVAVAVAATLILVWLALGVGILGADGDRANLMYSAVLVAGIIGSIVARLQPRGMTRVLVAMALVQTAITIIALMVGVQRSGVSPVAEIVVLNGFFITMFLASAWLFRKAAGEVDP